MSSARLDAALEHHAASGRVVQVAAVLDGEVIVDAASTPEGKQAVFPVFSVGKAIVALAVHLQVLRGLLELDAPVARYWPAYGSNGKQGITISQVLSHRAGVPQAPPNLMPDHLDDREWLTRWLEEVTPLYEPGTTNAYLPLTFGWILGELVRRTDPAARTIDVFVREELCEPLGADAFWFGIPAGIEPRVAQLTFPDEPPAPPAGGAIRAANPVLLGPEVFNRADVHRAVLPAVGAIADAESLARLFAVYAGHGVAGGRRYVSEASIDRCLTPRPEFDSADLTYGRRMPVGLGGLWIEAPGVVEPGRTGILAHPGAGSSVGWAELDRGLSVAICHDQMFATAAEYPDHPFSAIAEAVREMAGS